MTQLLRIAMANATPAPIPTPIKMLGWISGHSGSKSHLQRNISESNPKIWGMRFAELTIAYEMRLADLSQ